MKIICDTLNAPGKQECLDIMVRHQVPEHIIRHCEEVEKVARLIYNEIKSHGVHLDGDALFAAALLHDIARKEKKHALVGAELIKKIGYGFVGELIASHMDIEVCANEPVTEKEILYLADKLVKGERVCRIDERFRQDLKVKGNNPEAVEKIFKRWQAVKTITKKIECVTGKGFTHG